MRDDALWVLNRLRDAGHVAYFAGGCVRDLLLGAQPKDFDVATDAPPQRVQQIFRNTQAVGAAFGVILVRQGGSQIEVATFRAEAGYDDGRHPSNVRFTTAQEDALRRDFTINGLFFDPITEEVIDYVGGQSDIHARVVRAIGDPAERFNEDSLRLLRAVRFAARLGFAIDPDTAAAIKRHAPQLKRISPERIADELRTMLTPVTRGDAWRRLWELGLIPVIFRFASPANPEALMNRASLFERIAPGQAIPFGAALAAAAACYRLQVDRDLKDVRGLFSAQSVGSAMRAMRQALRISNDESEQMHGTLAGIEPLLADEFPRVALLKRFLAETTAWSSRQVLAGLKTLGEQSERIAMLESELARLELTEFAPEPLINGDVLTELGLAPGPVFKLILNDVYDAQLEGRIGTPEEAVRLALEINSSTRPPGPR